jgi:hypothetical protein
MPLTSFISSQKAAVQKLLVDPAERLMILRADPEMEVMAAKVIASFEEDEDSNSVFFGVSGEFPTLADLYKTAEATILENLAASRDAETAAEFPLEMPPAMDLAYRSPAFPIEVRFAEFVERVARELAPYCDSVVLVLKVDALASDESLQESIQLVASVTAHPAVKYLVFDQRKTPRLAQMRYSQGRTLTRAFPAMPKERRELLDWYFDSPQCRALHVRTDEAGRNDLVAMLSTRGDAANERDVIVLRADCSAIHPDGYFRDAAEAVLRSFLLQRTSLSSESRKTLEEAVQRHHFFGEPAVALCRFVERLLGEVAPRGGFLAVVLQPGKLQLREQFARAIVQLGEASASPRVKYLVIDSPAEPQLPVFEEAERIAPEHTFFIAPADIEKGVTEKLRSPTLTPLERMRYTAALAGFAFSHKRYDEAQKLQEEWLKSAEEADSPADIANACYSLGSTHLANGDAVTAGDLFYRSTEVCLSRGVNALLPLALSNLAIAVHRQGRPEEAASCFQAARDTYRGLGHRPGEAYILDTMAQVHASEGRLGEAESCWTEALALYDSIEADALQDVRTSGRSDIEDKLERLRSSGKETFQNGTGSGGVA